MGGLPGLGAAGQAPGRTAGPRPPPDGGRSAGGSVQPWSGPFARVLLGVDGRVGTVSSVSLLVSGGKPPPAGRSAAQPGDAAKNAPSSCSAGAGEQLGVVVVGALQHHHLLGWGRGRQPDAGCARRGRCRRGRRPRPAGRPAARPARPSRSGPAAATTPAARDSAPARPRPGTRTATAAPAPPGAARGQPQRHRRPQRLPEVDQPRRVDLGPPGQVPGRRPRVGGQPLLGRAPRVAAVLRGSRMNSSTASPVRASAAASAARMARFPPLPLHTSTAGPGPPPRRGTSPAGGGRRRSRRQPPRRRGGPRRPGDPPRREVDQAALEHPEQPHRGRHHGHHDQQDDPDAHP